MFGFQVKRANSSTWTGVNPTLASGEFGFETNTERLKIGNGSSSWNTLNYIDTAVLVANGFVDYQTTGAVANSTISSDTLFIRTAGYRTTGDGGGALYKRWAGSTPSSTGKGTKFIASNTGSPVYWELAPNPEVNVLQFGAHRDGSTDDTSAFSGLISFLNARSDGTQGGGIGFVPQGRYRINGTLPALSSMVGLQGEGPQATLLDFQNGSNDCFIFGAYGTPTRGQSLSGMYLGAQGKTGGRMIFAEDSFNAKIERISSESNWIGIEVGRRCNGFIIEDLFLSATQGATPVCLRWKAGASNADRCDVLTIRNAVLTGQWTDATCLEWDGAAYTLDAHTFRLLHAKYGIVVKNTANDASWYPSFMNVHNLQAEGFKQHAIWIQAGAGFKITGSDINNLSNGTPEQGNADLAALQIDPDASYSVTRSIQISDSKLGGSRREGAVINARDVAFVNVIFYSTSGAGSGSHPVIRCGSSAQDVQLANIRAEEFGGLARASYIVQLDSGATRVSGVNLDANFCATGDILDNSGNFTNVFTNIIRRNNALPSRTHNAVFNAVRFETSGSTEVRCENESTATSALSQFVAATATPDVFAQWMVHNGSGGTPYVMNNGGSAVTLAYTDFDTHIFRKNNATEKMRIKSGGQVQFIPLSAAPSGTANGDVYFDSTMNRLRVYINGAWANVTTS